MKMKTSWWGISLLAESGDDLTLLTSFIDTLPKKSEGAYERGEIDVIDIDNYSSNNDGWSFSDDEVKNSKMLVEISR